MNVDEELRKVADQGLIRLALSEVAHIQNVSEAARRVGVSEGTMRRWREGRLPKRLSAKTRPILERFLAERGDQYDHERMIDERLVSAIRDEPRYIMPVAEAGMQVREGADVSGLAASLIAGIESISRSKSELMVAIRLGDRLMRVSRLGWALSDQAVWAGYKRGSRYEQPSDEDCDHVMRRWFERGAPWMGAKMMDAMESPPTWLTRPPTDDQEDPNGTT